MLRLENGNIICKVEKVGFITIKSTLLSILNLNFVSLKEITPLTQFLQTIKIFFAKPNVSKAKNRCRERQARLGRQACHHTLYRTSHFTVSILPSLKLIWPDFDKKKLGIFINLKRNNLRAKTVSKHRILNHNSFLNVFF